MTKKRGLGIGLSELLSDIKIITKEDVTHLKSMLRNLPIDLLQPGKYQPRREMDQEALEELAASIRKQGIIQPLVVRQLKSGNYEIIAGERRWRAAQLAALHEIPAVVREISDETAIALSLIENIQRENLNAMDTAYGLQRLLDEFTMTHEAVAEAVSKSRATVTNLLRLLNLHDSVKTMLQRGELEMGHARAILALELHRQPEIAQIVAERDLSVRATENLIRNLQKPKSISQKTSDIHITKLQQEISQKLGAKTIINHTKSGKGKLTIKYNSLDELQGILSHLQ